MHAQPCTQLHTHIHMHTHTLKQIHILQANFLCNHAHTHTNTHTIHKCMRNHAHNYTHLYKCTYCTQTRAKACTQLHTHAHTHTYKHAHTYTHTRTHTHTYTHAHTQTLARFFTGLSDGLDLPSDDRGHTGHIPAPLPPIVSINSDYNDTQVGALLTSLAGMVCSKQPCDF